MSELVLHRAKSLVGWMSDAELVILAEFARESKSVFEIGCYFGRSTRALADNCKGKVHAIDSWEVINRANDGNPAFDSNIITYNLFRCNLNDHIASGKLIVNPVNWEDYQSNYTADFIFLDGDHKYEAVKHDILKAFDYLEPNGILSGHDYNWPGVAKAVNEIFPVINVKESIWWIRKS